MRSKTTRGEGLVPRWGGGGGCQNQRCQFAVPSHNSSLSYLGVPAPAGTSDCCESMSWTPIRDRLPRLISSFQRKLESRGVGRGNVVRGLVPRWGRGGAWQNPPCHFAVPIHNSGFSYLGVPAPAGMNDCYESMSRTTIRDRLPPLISSFQISLESRRGGEGQRHQTMDKPATGPRQQAPHSANSGPLSRHGPGSREPYLTQGH